MPHYVAFECNTQDKILKKIAKKVSVHFWMMRKDDRRAWIHAIGRTFLPKDPRLCSKLFEKHCFEESYLLELRLMGTIKALKLLKPDAIPMIFTHKLQDVYRVLYVRRRDNNLRLVKQYQFVSSYC